MMYEEIKRYLYLFSLLGAVLIMISGLVTLLIAAVAGSVSIWFIPFGSLPAVTMAVISGILAIIGIVIGLLIISEAKLAVGETTHRDHWVRMIVLSIVAFIVASGFGIGAVLVFLAGMIGFVFESGIDPFNLFHYQTRVCPDCGLVSSQHAKFCASCGKKFS